MPSHNARYSTRRSFYFFLGCLLLLVIFFHTFGVLRWLKDFSIQGALDRAIVACAHESERTKLIGCMRTSLQPVIKRWGTRAVMLALETRQRRVSAEDISRSRCHDMTHVIGSEGAKVRSVRETFAACTNLCESGCYHGAASLWLAQGNALVPILGQLCIDQTSSSEIAYSCFHGVGHVLGDMTELSFVEKLHACDSYPIEDRPPCGAGVFMAVYENTQTGAYARSLLGPDRPAWCAMFSDPYNEICYSFAGIYEYEQTGDFDAAVLVCNREPEEYKRGCIKDLGKSQYFSYPYDPALVSLARTYCFSYASGWERECFQNMLYVSPK